MIGRELARIGLFLLMSLLPLSIVRAEPLLIAHRGASGERPEHTLAAYERAIDQGADFIEPDLVLTKDGVLVARHENEIGGTTDVADHPEFADRKTTKVIDGVEMAGWFTEDFTLAELRTLRARERLPDLRPANKRFDTLYQIPTFEEILKLVRAKEAESRRRIGLYPETKHPSYFAGIGLAHQAPLLDLLNRYGYMTEADPVFIQSFEVGNLKALRAATRLRLIQLVDAEGGPADSTRSSEAARSAIFAAVSRSRSNSWSFARVCASFLRLVAPMGSASSGSPSRSRATVSAALMSSTRLRSTRRNSSRVCFSRSAPTWRARRRASRLASAASRSAASLPTTASAARRSEASLTKRAFLRRLSKSSARSAAAATRRMTTSSTSLAAFWPRCSASPILPCIRSNSASFARQMASAAACARIDADRASSSCCTRCSRRRSAAVGILVASSSSSGDWGRSSSSMVA